MASKKKKIQITIELKTKEDLEPYLQPTNPKVIVINAFHQFWGRCDVAESMLKKFQEEPANANKVDWVSIPFDVISDIVPKTTMGSKTKYYVFVKGEMFSAIDGIDLPLLKEEIIKAYSKFEETTS